MRLAEIDGDGVGRPASNPERFLQLRDRRGDQLHAGHAAEPGVAGGVIRVGVRMDDDERRRGSIVPFRPFGDQVEHHRRRLHLARARVLEQRLVASEDEIEERFFVVNAARFPKDEKVRVVLVNLPGRQLETIRAAREPPSGQHARLERRVRRRERDNGRQRPSGSDDSPKSA